MISTHNQAKQCTEYARNSACRSLKSRYKSWNIQYICRHFQRNFMHKKRSKRAEKKFEKTFVANQQTQLIFFTVFYSRHKRIWMKAPQLSNFDTAAQSAYTNFSRRAKLFYLSKYLIRSKLGVNYWRAVIVLNHLWLSTDSKSNQG